MESFLFIKKNWESINEKRNNIFRNNLKNLKNIYIIL